MIGDPTPLRAMAVRRSPRIVGVVGVALLTGALACRSATAPPAGGSRWALVSFNGQALPVQPAVFTYQIVADTLQFDVTSNRWSARPLAVSRRIVRRADGTSGTDEWWFTYDATEPLPASFALRALCADGDAQASCIDGRADATVDAVGLTVRFREPVLGVLVYTPVP